MEKQQFSIDDIANEQTMATIIAKRDMLILGLVQQIGQLQNENSDLKKQLEKPCWSYTQGRPFGGCHHPYRSNIASVQ